MDHKEQRHNAAEMTEHAVLKTVEHIIAESGEHLTHDELERLECAWRIIKNLYAGMTYAKQVGA